MDNLFKEFSDLSYQEWEEKLISDLKGLPIEGNLTKFNAFEDLSFKAYHKSELLEMPQESPGDFPYTRGSIQSRDWWIQASPTGKNPEEINKNALYLLEMGVSSLRIDISNYTFDDLPHIFKDIETKYIRILASVRDAEQASEAAKFLNGGEFALLIKSGEKPKDFLKHSVCLSSFGRQQNGANSSTEIAYNLAKGHEVLFELISSGFTVDDAASMIHFEFGVGSDYFFQIAKIRAFRRLWAQVVSAYEPAHACTNLAFISCRTGFVNKSLKDPYTNLLRQTTEVMSSALSDCNVIESSPYDSWSKNGASSLSQRMAINISLLLKEESYINQVSDALGGSYSLEALTEDLSLKAWTLFQEIENTGGFNSVQSLEKIKNLIGKSRAVLLNSYISGEKTLIGINKYELKDSHETLTWDESKLSEGALIIEKEIEG